jgi:D-3-phosphoglycerate dehydrogenase / 2-oxoglutarate reductase
MNILFASSIDQQAIDQLSQEHHVICAFGAEEKELQERISDRHVLVFRSGVKITAPVMSAAPQLRLLVRAGSGLDNLDLDYVECRKLPLVRIPGPGAQAVAEMAFGFMLALARNIPHADQLTRNGRWAKHEINGYLLRGKTLGIIGTGNIGTRVGEMGAAWGVNVIGCVENPSPTRMGDLYAKGIYLMSCNEVLERADFLSIHLPLKESTINLIDEKALSLMKPGAFLVNLARGGVVDEQALYQALTRENRLAGAALDVHKQEGEGKISPLADLPNVILTPHIGAMTIDSQREIGKQVVETIKTFSRAV